MTRTGVLLINTGTADEPTVPAIRAYLEDFLTDRMLFADVPMLLWKLVVKLCILPHRPKRTLPRYEKLWEDGEFRFNRVSEAQRRAVEAELDRRNFNGGDFFVELGMRYGNPSVMSRLRMLGEFWCERLVVVPLYPQSVTVCAGTCHAEVDRCLGELSSIGWKPQVLRVWDFCEQPAYLQAMADSIAARWSWRPGAKLVYCWHSTLMTDIEKLGDVYRRQCEETAAAVSERLGVPREGWTIAYQSRFDTRKWLGPFADQVMPQLAREGVRDVCACCPGFVADNIENVTETGEDLRDVFLAAAGAGARYTFVPALNDAPGLAGAIANEIERATTHGA